MNDMPPSPFPWLDLDNGACPVAETLRTLGGKHKPRLLHSLLAGELHFLELTRVLSGISRKVLTEQLRDLEQAGLIGRKEKNDARKRVAYFLTPKGQALGDILSQIYIWSKAY
jgi:DNA-binding HxlR family transcriptional regulator